MLMGLLAACCGEEEKRKIEYIYLHYGKTIFYIIHKRVESQSDAEDLTHDLFVKLIKMSDRLDLSKPGKLYSLLVILAKNMVVDFMRKCRETDFDDSEAGEIYSSDAILNSRSPVDFVLGRENYQELLSCIGKLKERDKIIFQLKYIHGYDNAEIAEFLELPSVREISDRLYEGKRILMKMIGGDRYFEDGQKKRNAI